MEKLPSSNNTNNSSIGLCVSLRCAWVSFGGGQGGHVPQHLADGWTEYLMSPHTGMRIEKNHIFQYLFAF